MPKRFAKIVQHNQNVYETQVYKTHHYLIKGAGKMGLVVVLAPGITRMLEKLISLHVLLAFNITYG